MHLETAFTLSTEVVFQEVAGECVLLDLKTEEYFGLDEIGTVIWQTLAEGLVAEAAIAKLLESYAVEESMLRNDVNQLLTELVESGLIKPASE